MHLLYKQLLAEGPKILPIGLEKRVFGDIGTIAAKLNATNASGVRMLAVSGTIVTELDALERLTGVNAELVAAGGIYGAEGSCWIAVTGREDQVGQALALTKSCGRACFWGVSFDF